MQCSQSQSPLLSRQLHLAPTLSRHTFQLYLRQDPLVFTQLCENVERAVVVVMMVVPLPSGRRPTFIHHGGRPA